MLSLSGESSEQEDLLTGFEQWEKVLEAIIISKFQFLNLNFALIQKSVVRFLNYFFQASRVANYE